MTLRRVKHRDTLKSREKVRLLNMVRIHPLDTKCVFFQLCEAVQYSIEFKAEDLRNAFFNKWKQIIGVSSKNESKQLLANSGTMEKLLLDYAFLYRQQFIINYLDHERLSGIISSGGLRLQNQFAERHRQTRAHCSTFDSVEEHTFHLAKGIHLLLSIDVYNDMKKRLRYTYILKNLTDFSRQDRLQLHEIFEPTPFPVIFNTSMKIIHCVGFMRSLFRGGFQLRFSYVNESSFPRLSNTSLNLFDCSGREYQHFRHHVECNDFVECTEAQDESSTCLNQHTLQQCPAGYLFLRNK